MKTMINIKTDKDLKEKAQKVARELDLPLSTIINAYLRKFIVTQEVNFSVAPKMTAKLEKLISRVERDLKKGKNLSPVFTSDKEMLDYLHSK